MNHEYYMKVALEEARKAYEKNEVPVGAVIVISER
jgi:tRNA(adenine34) deaminase